MTSTARVQRYRARQQAASGLQATRYAGPWTLEDDAELLHGAGTVLDRAVRLGRTYLACCARLARLRERLETTEAPP